MDPYAQPVAPVADPNAYPGAPVYQGDPNAYPGAPVYQAAPNAYPGAAPVDPNGYPAASYPAAPAPAPRKPLPKGALIGIIAGGAVVVLAIAAAVVVPLLTRAPQASASDFVGGYLAALADGDAEKALTYVEANGDDDLLTADVLKASLKLGAIDDIVVGKSESKNSYGDVIVPVTFTIGDTEVSRDFEVYTSTSRDEMSIVDGLVRMSSPYGFEGLGLTVNGAEVPDYTYVFPGTYQFAIGPEAFAIEGETTFVLGSDDDAEALYDVKPVLSEAGTAKFRELVNASFAECLAMKSLDTPCGMNVSDMTQDGYTPVDGTVTRTIDAEAQSKLANLEPYVSERAIVTTMDYWGVDITLQATNGSSTADFEVLFGARVLTPKVDFSAETPSVIWE
ncbi:MAG: hypothetical protein J7484_10550 [Microbacterium sp.]|nr:hypothetical protein [Microbacterium sp.]